MEGPITRAAVLHTAVCSRVFPAFPFIRFCFVLILYGKIILIQK